MCVEVFGGESGRLVWPECSVRFEEAHSHIDDWQSKGRRFELNNTVTIASFDTERTKRTDTLQSFSSAARQFDTTERHLIEHLIEHTLREAHSRCSKLVLLASLVED